ncbi:MAG: hypothetical protein PHG29_13905 [Prolixibacteraceae bacterium]|jgi:hypothetical protein|nr:hypothetical protein [Prolixibacteraceae bacterium]
MGAIKSLFVLMRAFLASRLSLAAEILALRQQVAVYKHTVKRPKLRKRDRVFWVWLSRLWSNWRSGLVIVQPARLDIRSARTKGNLLDASVRPLQHVQVVVVGVLAGAHREGDLGPRKQNAGIADDPLRLPQERFLFWFSATLSLGVLELAS